MLLYTRVAFKLKSCHLNTPTLFSVLQQSIVLLLSVSSQKVNTTYQES